MRVGGVKLALAALKRAEDGDGLVLRAYEPHGARGAATLEVAGLRRAERVNLLEEDPRPLEVAGGRVTLEVRPFEVVTLRLRFA